tara:strand:- start:2320 stop:3156 length:837 start_codon:yes stop_codon:yes gene_type:complete
MATVTTTIKLASSDLTTNTLALTTAATQSPTGSSGLSRAKITSTSKAVNISVTDGDATRTAAEGKFLDIIDNHGLKKRYVWTDASTSGAATGAIIASNTDIGSTSSPDASLVGGIAVQYGSGTTQNGQLVLLKAAIEHADGHNGSITVSTVPGEANGVQAIDLTNAVTGESGCFTIDTTTSTWDSTYGLNAATNSQHDHTVLYTPNTYASGAYLYVKNTATNAAHTLTIYDAATLGEDNIMTLAGGQAAFFPIEVASHLKAITSNSGTIVEFMHLGTE